MFEIKQQMAAISSGRWVGLVLEVVITNQAQGETVSRAVFQENT